MYDLADVGAVAGELRAGRFDVLGDEVGVPDEPGAASVIPVPKWTDAADPGGVSCTIREAPKSMSASWRQPTAW